MVNSHRRKLAPKCRFNFSLCFLFRFTNSDLVFRAIKRWSNNSWSEQDFLIPSLSYFEAYFRAGFWLGDHRSLGADVHVAAARQVACSNPHFWSDYKRSPVQRTVLLSGLVWAVWWVSTNGGSKNLSAWCWPSLLSWANFFFGKSGFILFWVSWCLH